MRKRKCKGCGHYFRPEEGTPVYVKWCDDDCRESMALDELAKVIKRNVRAIEKAKKTEKKKHAKAKRVFYENDVSTRRKAATHFFNRFIRLRDSALPNAACISCGKPVGSGSFDAGHYVPAGGGATSSYLRFDEENVNLQCHWNCNIQKSGNLREYRKGLIAKYGQQTVDRIEGPQDKVKPSAEYYKAIEVKYKKKCAELEALHMEQGR